jgi:hypothetical protein
MLFNVLNLVVVILRQTEQEQCEVFTDHQFLKSTLAKKTEITYVGHATTYLVTSQSLSSI